MNYLNTLIDNKGFEFNIAYVECLNVKKFCDLHGYHYSNIPEMYDDISEIHLHLRRVETFENDPIIVHIDYDENMKDRPLKELLDDRGMDKRIFVILTNNKGYDIPEPILARSAFKYKPEDTGFSKLFLTKRKLKRWI